MRQWFGYMRIFWALTCRDLKAFRKTLGSKLMDNMLLFSTSVLVFAYFMPFLGLSNDFGVMIFASCFVVFSFFDSLGFASLIVMDLEGDRTIIHTMGVPMPSSFTLAQTAVSWALLRGLMTIIGLPLGKILLGSQLVLSAISYGKFFVAYVTIYLMFGFFGLWLAALVRRLSNIGSLFVRVGNPMFMFGAYMFTWATAFKLSPLIGYILLINPMVYANEAMRVSVVGQAGFLPFGLSVAILWIFTCFFAWHSIRTLKRRLDLP